MVHMELKQKRIKIYKLLRFMNSLRPKLKSVLYKAKPNKHKLRSILDQLYMIGS